MTDEIRRRLDAAGPVLRVESMDVAGNTLFVRYRHSAVGAPAGGYGLQRQLNYPPPVGEPNGDLAAWLGAWIAEGRLGNSARSTMINSR